MLQHPDLRNCFTFEHSRDFQPLQIFDWRGASMKVRPGDIYVGAARCGAESFSIARHPGTGNIYSG